jgi:hypothetical protein
MTCRGRAQDANYWSQQYGTRSQLLGGAVIGSVNDLSAAFYNPAAIAIFQKTSILLSTHAYEYNSLSVQGDQATKELTSSSISPAPDLAASSIPFDWLGSDRLAISFLVRNQDNVDVQNRAGNPTSVAEFLYSDDLKDLWVGLTWGHLLGEHVGIGITQFVSIRDQDRRTQLVAERIGTGGAVDISTFIREFNYQNYRLLWKAGIGFELSPLTMGLTVGTPSVGLFGGGSALYDLSSTGFDLDGDGQPDNILSANYQDDIDTHFESSWTVGVGGAYDIGKLKLHFSVEWFDAVKKFDILNTADFVSRSSGDTLSNPLSHESKSVVNYGLGVEYLLGQKTTAYVSFTTDYSAAVNGTQTNLSVLNYDISHVAGGLAFTLGRWDLIVGGTYSFGNDKLNNVIQGLDQIQDNPLLDPLHDADVKFTRVRFLFGFSFALSNESSQ